MSELFRRLWSVALVAVLCTVFATPVALADAPPPEDGVNGQAEALIKIDKWFGKVVVAPLGAAMFFDIAFWDNTLPLGEGIGTEADNEVVTSYDPVKGYAWSTQVEVPANAKVVPQLAAPVTRRVGSVEVEVSTDGPKITSTLSSDPLDLAALGIQVPELPEGVEPTGPVPQTIDDPNIAPFAFDVDLLTGKPLSKEVNYTPKDLEVVAGVRVWTPEGTGTVIETGPEKLVFTLDEVRYSNDALPNPDQLEAPIVVIWLVLGAIFFTLRMSFISIRGFWHAIRVTIGDYDDPNEPGEISHFQALSSALSATVGLGNIAGVAVAIGAGGPGAVFWMVVAALLGMNSKFVEVSLGQMYRVIKPDGSVSGGPMHYLKDGLREMGLGPLGTVLSAVFAIMCIGGSFGGGNMFQANQSYDAVAGAGVALGLADTNAWLPPSAYGLALAFAVGLVIIGGIKRIGQIAGLIVPVMCAVYVAAGLYIMVVNYAAVPEAFTLIVTRAFSPEAVGGGFLGVMIQGFRRAAFSNEAGVGSASIAHSAASTNEPIREGIVALLEPFIDTVVVCTMTGIVVVVSGAYKIEGIEGIQVTSRAFSSAISWFPIVLSFAVLMFAFSTMISWSYYGERCATFLFGDAAVTPYRMVFLFFVWFGSIASLDNVIGFSDLMILGMAFPNILGAVLLSGKVRERLDRYWASLNAGEFKVHRS